MPRGSSDVGKSNICGFVIILKNVVRAPLSHFCVPRPIVCAYCLPLSIYFRSKSCLHIQKDRQNVKIIIIFLSAKIWARCIFPHFIEIFKKSFIRKIQKNRDLWRLSNILTNRKSWRRNHQMNPKFEKFRERWITWVFQLKNLRTLLY